MYSSGTMFWYSLNGWVSARDIRDSLKMHLPNPEEFVFKTRNSKSAFLRAVRKNSNFTSKGYLTRKVFHEISEIRIAIVKEEKISQERLDLEQESLLIYRLLDKDLDTSEIQYKCPCGQKIKMDNVGEYCPSCQLQIPKLISEIRRLYKRDLQMVDSTHRGEFIRDCMFQLGAIRLSRHGRPYYTPEQMDEKGFSKEKENKEENKISDLMRAVNSWGDRASIFPIKEEAVSNVQQEAISVFHDEIAKIKNEINKWDSSTRDSTKRKRIENLDSIRKKLKLYSYVLKDAEKEIKEGIEQTIEKIKEVV
jgi:hypothetical protein